MPAMRSAVDGLCSFAGRGACTDAERRAAVWLHDELRSRGHEAYVETRWVRPQRALTLALGALLAIAGSLLATASALPGLIVAALGALVLALHAAGLPLPLLPRRATQHVLAGDAPLRHRRRLRRPAPWPRAQRPLAARSCDRRAAPAICGVAVAAAAGARLAEVDAGWLGAAQLVPTVVLLSALAAAVDIAVSGWSPGANDNAAGGRRRLLDELHASRRAARPRCCCTAPATRSRTRSGASARGHRAGNGPAAPDRRHCKAAASPSSATAARTRRRGARLPGAHDAAVDG